MFDVNVEGTTSFRDIDVFARAGANRADAGRSAVSDGTVDVTFVAGVQNPTVSAIEVVTTASAVPPLLARPPRPWRSPTPGSGRPRRRTSR